MALYIFDKDKTLLKRKRNWLNLPLNPRRPEEQRLKPGVRQKLDDLRRQDHAIALASNQSMVAKGTITLEEANRLMEDCAQKAGGVDAWRLCPCEPMAKLYFWVRNPYKHDDPNRKPHPGMIQDIMKELGYSPDNTIMVGDSKVDRKAAEAAGVHFIPEQEFFPQPDHGMPSRREALRSPAALLIGSLIFFGIGAGVVLWARNRR